MNHKLLSYTALFLLHSSRYRKCCINQINKDRWCYIKFPKQIFVIYVTDHFLAINKDVFDNN